MSAAPSIDLSAIPESQRAAVLAVLRERDALQETNRRLEHLIAELNQVLHGKRSEKLNDDERQSGNRVGRGRDPAGCGDCAPHAPAPGRPPQSRASSGKPAPRRTRDRAEQSALSVWLW